MRDDSDGSDDVVEILSIGDEDYESEDMGSRAAAMPPEAAQEELARLRDEVEQLKELHLRKLADFDNYRKRSAREMADARKYANAELVRECLPVVDNLERALAVPPGDGDGLRIGVELVLRQFKDVLARFGIEEVDPQGAPFDPSLHEAVARRETSEVPENHVAHVLQKGYVMGEKLLRPALVDVAVASAQAPDAPDAATGDER